MVTRITRPMVQRGGAPKQAPAAEPFAQKIEKLAQKVAAAPKHLTGGALWLDVMTTLSQNSSASDEAVMRDNAGKLYKKMDEAGVDFANDFLLANIKPPTQYTALVGSRLFAYFLAHAVNASHETSIDNDAVVKACLAVSGQITPDIPFLHEALTSFGCIGRVLLPLTIIERFRLQDLKSFFFAIKDTLRDWNQFPDAAALLFKKDAADFFGNPASSSQTGLDFLLGLVTGQPVKLEVLKKVAELVKDKIKKIPQPQIEAFANKVTVLLSTTNEDDEKVNLCTILLDLITAKKYTAKEAAAKLRNGFKSSEKLLELYAAVEAQIVPSYKVAFCQVFSQALLPEGQESISEEQLLRDTVKGFLPSTTPPSIDTSVAIVLAAEQATFGEVIHADAITLSDVLNNKPPNISLNEKLSRLQMPETKNFLAGKLRELKAVKSIRHRDSRKAQIQQLTVVIAALEQPRITLDALQTVLRNALKFNTQSQSNVLVIEDAFKKTQQNKARQEPSLVSLKQMIDSNASLTDIRGKLEEISANYKKPSSSQAKIAVAEQIDNQWLPRLETLALAFQLKRDSVEIEKEGVMAQLDKIPVDRMPVGLLDARRVTLMETGAPFLGLSSPEEHFLLEEIRDMDPADPNFDDGVMDVLLGKAGDNLYAGFRILECIERNRASLFRDAPLQTLIFLVELFTACPGLKTEHLSQELKTAIDEALVNLQEDDLNEDDRVLLNTVLAAAPGAVPTEESLAKSVEIALTSSLKTAEEQAVILDTLSKKSDIDHTLLARVKAKAAELKKLITKFKAEQAAYKRGEPVYKQMIEAWDAMTKYATTVTHVFDTAYVALQAIFQQERQAVDIATALALVNAPETFTYVVSSDAYQALMQGGGANALGVNDILRLHDLAASGSRAAQQEFLKLYCKGKINPTFLQGKLAACQDVAVADPKPPVSLPKIQSGLSYFRTLGGQVDFDKYGAERENFYAQYAALKQAELEVAVHEFVNFNGNFKVINDCFRESDMVYDIRKSLIGLLQIQIEAIKAVLAEQPKLLIKFNQLQRLFEGQQRL